jgi:hypothetical protein
MYPAGNLFIAAPHGRLEAIIKEPNADKFPRPRGAALVLHPHPLHGGTMHNKVVFRAARALNEAGLVALRINFRGVGLSTGTHDRARGEQTDARHALDYLREHYRDLPLTLAGFSFGARVGLEVGVSDERVSRLIGLGTPLKMYDFSFLRECRKPLLFVHGERDEFGDAREVERLASELPPAAEARAVIVRGAGHFFEQQLDEMQRAIREWAEEVKR